MRTRLTFALLVVLALLGLANFGMSMKNRFSSHHVPSVEAIAPVAPVMPEAPPAPDAPAAPMAPEAVLASFEGEHTTVIDETYTVSPGDLLAVEVSHADVRITTATDNQARIRVTIEGPDAETIREVIDRMNFSTHQEGRKVVLESRPERQNWWTFNWWDNVSIHVEATIPARFDTQITTSHGELAVASLEGQMELTTSHGNVHLAEMQGPFLSIVTSHGEVAAERLDAPDVNVTTSHGDIRIGTVSGQRFNASTSHSTIAVERLGAASDINTSHGDIEIGLTQATDLSLQTSHGSIDIAAPPSLRADVSLRGDDVNISSAYRFSGELGEDKAEGRINGGGARLEARTSHGDITLREL